MHALQSTPRRTTRSWRSSGNRSSRIGAGLLAAMLLLSTAGCSGDTSPKIEADGTLTVAREVPPRAAAIADQAVAIALRAHVHARLVTEPFVTADLSKPELAEVAGQVEQATEAWALADQAAVTAVQLTAAADVVLARAGGQAAGYLGLGAGPMAAVVPQRMPADASADQQAWAENFTKRYDAIQGNRKLQSLAKELGVDAHEVHAQLEAAQAIIRNEATADAAFWEKMTKAAMAVKTGTKVGLFVASTVATGGGSLAALSASSLTLGQAGVVIVGGVDAIVDIGATGSTIVLGEKHAATAAFNDLKDKIAPVSAVVGLVGLSSAGLEDQLSYLGDSLTDWFYEGKIMGIVVSGKPDGTTTQKVALVAAGETTEQTRSNLEAVGLELPEASTPTLAEVTERFADDPAGVDATLAQLLAEMAALAGTPSPAATATAAESEPVPAPVDVSGTYQVTGTYRTKWSDGEVDSSKLTPFKATVTLDGDAMKVVLGMKTKTTLAGTYNAATGVFNGKGKQTVKDPLGTPIWQLEPTRITFQTTADPITAKAVTASEECADCVVTASEAVLKLTRVAG
ncbi:MAG TPA: hypothetical protein PLB21_07260 [Actinomycetota bacterium]|nr:hypothetical protein [Actinomycetota bacterium]